jgi:peptidoglycan hydrolase CwlO-like protein
LRREVEAHATDLANLEQRAASYAERTSELEAHTTELVDRLVTAETATIAERNLRDSIRTKLDEALAEQARLRTALREAEGRLEALQVAHGAALARETTLNAGRASRLARVSTQAGRSSGRGADVQLPRIRQPMLPLAASDLR